MPQPLTQSTGRRKQAIARVRLVPGSGTITVNGRTLEDYFPNKLHQQLINDPFTVLDLAGAYDVIARISGGGPSGQAGALRLGIARALMGEPSLLLADEPTAALDADRSQEIVALLRQLTTERNIACGFVTHDRSLIESSDEVFELGVNAPAYA